MKIAYFSPINPQKSGISDYSEFWLLPYLSHLADIDIFIDKDVVPQNREIKKKFKIIPYYEYENIKESYDIAVYHMGNNYYHEYIYRTLINNPGITVFHDIYLHGLLWWYSINQGNPERYREELIYCYGDLGAQIADHSIRTNEFKEFEYPYIKRILDNSIGVICHSEFSIQVALREKSDINITKINMPVPIPHEIEEINSLDGNEIKRKYSLKSKKPIITSFGYIYPHKRYDVLLKSFKSLLSDYPHAELVLVGEDNMNIQDLIKSFDLSSSVIVTGYVPESEIVNYLAISDFCVNLRYPTAGETSASVLKIMAAKKAVIVSDVGWFSEIPNDCCQKVPVDDSEEKVLLNHLRNLTANPDLNESIGKNAQNWVKINHNPDRVAESYFEYITSVINGNELIIKNLSRELKFLGIKESDDEIIRYVTKTVVDLL